MTALLDHAVLTARTLSPDQQDAIARLVLSFLEGDAAFAPLSEEDEASFAPSLAQAEAGDFVTDEELRAIWSKHGL